MSDEDRQKLRKHGKKSILQYVTRKQTENERVHERIQKRIHERI